MTTKTTTAQGPALTYGPDYVLQVDTRYPTLLRTDQEGDYGVNSGYYGSITDLDDRAWSVETGYSPLRRDMAYWTRVRDNAHLIDQVMATQPRRLRLKVRFEGDAMVISDYDWDRPVATVQGV